MPTRAIGDFRLKNRNFNFHQFDEGFGYRRPIPTYTGPYITHKPDIQVFELSAQDRYLVLATDGLWDEMSRKKAAQFATQA